MDVEVTEEKENPLLERKEVVVRISHKGSATPTREDIRKKLSAKLSASDDRLVIGPLDQSYGAATAIAKVKIYKSKERALRVESPHVIRKNFPEVEAPKPALEKPAEVKKEVGEKGRT